MIPSSTYRWQLNAGFPLTRAAQLTGYLDRLGIGAAYLSPILSAHPGSQHGYDICDHNSVNPELGGEEGFRALSEGLQSRSLGCILDFVPNHMSADAAYNMWLRDVLENGPASAYAPFFDIDWELLKPEMHGKVLLPVLGDQYGRVLGRGELRLEYAEGALSLRYFDQSFPISPRSLPEVLQPEGTSAGFDETGQNGMECLSILTALRNLPGSLETDPERAKERRREGEVARKRLSELTNRSPEIRAFISQRIEAINGVPGDEKSFDALHHLLDRQNYRLAFWRTAGHEINYRRFFDVNGLIGLRMEHPEALQATHGLLLRLIRSGRITGIRLDHVDGLQDPTGYLRALRAMVREAQAEAGGAVPDDLYIVAEKILTGEEVLRSGWPIQGTTGYEYVNDLNGLFVDPQGARSLDGFYRLFTGWRGTLSAEILACKRLVLATAMMSELTVLASRLDRISEADRNSRDFTLESLRQALAEVIAAFPVYRTYGNAQGFAPEDRMAIDLALKAADAGNPAIEPATFRFLRNVLLLSDGSSPGDPGDSIPRDQRLQVMLRFQQLTSPVQAKGFEDTVLYRRGSLLSLNEVGGNPDSRGLKAADFHAHVLARGRTFPHGMVATSTHDTKRGEDGRARLNVLSGFPGEWEGLVHRLSGIIGSRPESERAETEVMREDEYFLYQTLLASWPVDESGKPEEPDAAFRDRVAGYMLKAVREAKVRTSWINPNAAYEKKIGALIDTLLFGECHGLFLAAFLPFIGFCAPLGALHSLGQTALKCALPGVPDVYQGCERWNLALGDPDNRRPVEYAALASSLAGMEAWIDPEGKPKGRRDWVQPLLDHWGNGEIKQYVLARSLRWRRANQALFSEGAYIPLETGKGAASEWIAFAREKDGATLIACVRIRRHAGEGMKSGLRDPLSRKEAGMEEALLLPMSRPGSRWVNLFTDTVFTSIGVGREAALDLAAIAMDFPVAWLLKSA